jgi:hypothetical protein
MAWRAAGHGTAEERTLDAAEPPRIVFESAPECTDRDRAEDQLRQALASSRAPGPGWVVTIRIQPSTPPAVSAQAEITSPGGAPLSHDSIQGDASNCAALATAMAAWASETLRAKLDQPLPPAPSPAPSPAPALSPTPTPAPSSPTSRPIPHPASPPAESPSPAETVDYEMPALELGVGPFLMVGGAAGGYAGITPFVVDEITPGVFLRPSLAIGQSLATNLTSTWAAARLDTCARLPGRYASRNGIQLDLCGGPDVGFSYIASGTLPGTPLTSKTVPYVSLGPSLDLHGEVGNLAVSLRGVIGINVAREGFVDVTGVQVDAPALSWRLELDFSWALRR